MLLLLGAIGTASAPVAQAAAGDLCAILGPFPTLEEDANDLLGHDIQGKLLVGDGPYLFIVVIEDYADDEGIQPLNFATASVDDEEGDADVTSYVIDDDLEGVQDPFNNVPGNQIGEAEVTVSGVDVLPNVPVLIDLDTDLEDELDASYDLEAGLEGALDIGIGAAATDDFDTITDALLDGVGCGTATDEAFAIVDVECEDPGRFELTFHSLYEVNNSITEEFLCVENANAATLTATPTTVESVPAPGNISHSLLVVTLTDADGNPAAPGQQVDWTTDRCRIDGLSETEYETDAPGSATVGAGALFAGFTPATAADIEATLSGHGGLSGAASSDSFENDANPSPAIFTMRTIAAAILHCEGAAPGVANVVAEIERDGPDLRATTTVTVVGPPAFITITAAPNRLVCGEKATILVTVTDAINQRVSDHTRVELITNFGGVLGGTGATLGFPGQQLVSPLSSGAAETFGGVATAYLLTSTQHVGAYEVVAAAGGSIPSGTGGTSGVFSTPVVSSQVTVTCTLAAAPTTTAPSTGTGSITPPSTGDAGLAAPSGSTSTLYVILGAVAFAMAGLASFGYARR
jgi:hypothetical protein